MKAPLVMSPFIDHTWFTQMDAATFIRWMGFKMRFSRVTPAVFSGCLNLLGRILIMDLPWGVPASVALESFKVSGNATIP